MKAPRTSRPAPKAPEPGPDKGSRSTVAPTRSAPAPTSPPPSVSKARGKKVAVENPIPSAPIKVEKKKTAPVTPPVAPPVAPEKAPTSRRPRRVEQTPVVEVEPPSAPVRKRAATPKTAPPAGEVKKTPTQKVVASPVAAPAPKVALTGKKNVEVALVKSPPPKEKSKPKVVKEVVEVPVVKALPKPRVAVKKAAPRRKADTRITLYVARGGPARGHADYEQAFPNRPQALAFLSNQHGLSTEEQRQLAKSSRLKLNRRWHGSEACALREITLDPDQAVKVLKGEVAVA